MKKVEIFGAAIVLFVSFVVAHAQEKKHETEVRRAVEAFFAAFNAHDFKNVPNITTNDWTHINPFGGETVGRVAVLQELTQVHGTFLKGVTMKIEEMKIKLAGAEAAVVTVKNTISTYTSQDGIKHENERQIKTFVLIKKAGKWLITQDHNTIIVEPKKLTPKSTILKRSVKRAFFRP